MRKIIAVIGMGLGITTFGVADHMELAEGEDMPDGILPPIEMPVRPERPDVPRMRPEIPVRPEIPRPPRPEVPRVRPENPRMPDFGEPT